MLVTKHNFDSVLSTLSKEKILGFDTETTCIPWWDNLFYKKEGIAPRVFSMQFATDVEEFYFDFNDLNDTHFKKINSELTQNPDTLWRIANAKFDMHHCANHGVLFAGTIHCTKAIARVVDNLEPSLSLDALGEKYLGVAKIDVLSKIKSSGFATQIKKWGHNDKYEEVLHFDRLELSELVEYGKRDTRLCYDLGDWQDKTVTNIDREIFVNKDLRLRDVVNNERKLTKICFEMEREGIHIDRAYTEEAYEHEVKEYLRIEQDLNRVSIHHIGKKIDWLSAKQLKPLFDAVNEPYTYTAKGNASFDREALEESDSQLAKQILRYRYHNKRAHTYFENFIWLADSKNILHADSQQAGTQFARMSYWNPNLQNIPKRRDKDEAKYKVRRCFIPKPGTVLADFDYSGAEYYMTMDYARELPVIEQLQNGLDPHEKLRIDMGLKDRDESKTMQFRILYGAGQEAVGKSLGYKGFDARRIGKQKKAEYFKRLPKVAELITQVASTAKTRGYIFNWLGRILQYDQNTAYKATNGLIQSGVGDMTKTAMCQIFDTVLPGYKSKMILQVHDSLLFNLHVEEISLIPKIKAAMVQAYPYKVLPMEADVGFSSKSWAELQDSIISLA